MRTLPEGLLLVDKPSGPTSHDVVERIRRGLRQPRAGHGGTLDPGASGLLPIALGRATRLVRFLPQAPKIYVGRLRLGITTTTDDLAGDVVALATEPMPGPSRVLASAAALVGRFLQVPPTVAARKIGGERMYRLARAGVAVVAPATEVEVTRFDLTPTEDPAEWGFVAHVSAGTYVRALARDLGAELGCGGAVARLRRTAIGPLRVEDAVTMPPADGPPDPGWAAAVLPLEMMPIELPTARLANEDAGRRFRSGLPSAAWFDGEPRGTVRVLDGGGTMVGVGEAEGTVVRPRIVLDVGPERPPGGRRR